MLSKAVEKDENSIEFYEQGNCLNITRLIEKIN